MNPVFERQFEDLRNKYDDVQQTRLPSGSILIEVAPVRLPPGWNQESTKVRFLAPVGYPHAAPDCFWADKGLALANNSPPQASNQQQIPETVHVGTWFSWHVQNWKPNKDSLLSFTHAIEHRLRQVK